MAIMRRFYWRSVRADIQRFVENCEHCRGKKITGQKLLKAPIDVTKDDCIEVTVRSKIELKDSPENRFIISIDGIDESVYPLFLNARMTSYTFKETHNRRPIEIAPRIRGRPYSKRRMAGSIQQKKQPTKQYIPMGHCLDGFHDIYAKRPEYITEWVQISELKKLTRNLIEIPSTNREECPDNIDTSPLRLQKQIYSSERSKNSISLASNMSAVEDDQINPYESESNSSVPLAIRMHINGMAARNAAILARMSDTDLAVGDTSNIADTDSKLEFDDLPLYCFLVPIY